MKKTLISIGIGAGLMYLFDPEVGEVRRSLLKDKMQGVMPQTKEALEHKAEVVAAKATEVAAKADSVAAEKIESLGGDAIHTSDDAGGKDAA